MDPDQAAVFRSLLLGSNWIERTDDFAGAMRSATRRADGLMLLGTPEHEPWHLAAHLDDEADLSGAVDLRPTLLRWAPPPDAPPHLSFGIDRLKELRRGEPLLIVSEGIAQPSMLERIDDARRAGGRIFTLGERDRELSQLAHESLMIDDGVPDLVTLDLAEHLLSMSAAAAESMRGWRGSLRRLLDRVSGP
jgi:hypothetical protein